MGPTNSAPDFVIHGHKIGISNVNPQHALDVIGSINFTGNLMQNGTPFTLSQNQSQWVSDASSISVSSNVIIGSTGNSKSLTVNGMLTASNLNILGTTTIINTQTTVSCNLTLDSAFAGGEALTVNGIARFACNVYFKGIEIGDYALESWVTDQNYLTSAGLSGYATCNYVTGLGYITTPSLSNYLVTSNYATQSYVGNQGYITTTGLSNYLATSNYQTAAQVTSSINAAFGNNAALIDALIYASNVGTSATADLNLGSVGYTTNVLGALSSSNLVVGTSITANDINVNGTIQTYNAIVDGTLYATSNVSVAGMLYAQQFTLGSHLTPARIMGPLTVYNTHVYGSLIVSSNITAQTLTLGGFTFSLASATELNIKLNGSNVLTLTNV
jgi:hypothetical protein